MSEQKCSECGWSVAELNELTAENERLRRLVARLNDEADSRLAPETFVAEELRRDRERMCAPETPADLVGALQDRAHVDAGPFRAGQSVKETGGDDVSR